MYISGHPYTLERRIHQLLESQDDYDDYLAEYESIQNDLPTYIQIKVERELDKKKSIYRLNDVPEEGTFFILTENGNFLMTENSNNLIKD